MGETEKGFQTQKNSKSSGKESFPVVGIGASAGGLEAFKELLENLPANTGMAFVVIQHLASGQESLLTEILKRSTDMPVLEVKEGTRVEPNHVYVIPPGTTMTLKEGFLKLRPKEMSLKPIDTFLNSLASERKTKAIGIILSGTGTDGTEGLKAIKAEGGITFAQDPKSAQYAGMPQSAIATECVYFILSPKQIAKELSRIAKHPHLIRAEIKALKPKAAEETSLKTVFRMLKSSFNVDFTHYKEPTVHRRIARRMVINQIGGIKTYVEYLRTHLNELQALFDDMLIGVTSFFREPNTFLVLKEKVFPELVKNGRREDPIRFWIPGCSTGEEVYSFAIALEEYLEEKAIPNVSVQIFGTDVNEQNIEKARQGIYPKNIETYVSENRLRRFFSSYNGNYQVTKPIRDMCIFAKHDITADPPFSNLDLISCRNVLIYFDSYLQEKALPTLHYALKPNGFLVLGESESIGKSTDLFEPINKKRVIYVKKKGQTAAAFGLGVPVPYTRKNLSKEPDRKDLMTLLKEVVDRLLTTEYAPATLLVNNNSDILVFRGQVTPYLSPESGTASLNLAKIIRKELRNEVQTAVYKARKENKMIKEEAVSFESEGQPRTINIQVFPLRISQYDEPFFLVVFEDVSSAAAHLRQAIELTATPGGRANLKDRQIRELQVELDSTKHSLQNIIEAQEATNEELRAAMEEVQSSNEELQSTNEELETAKEELQSGNEELKTLNEELKNRNQALAQLNDDLANLVRNVDVGVVMVDCDLRIRRFTPSAQEILKLSPSDMNRRLTDIHLSIAFRDLEKTIIEVITKLNDIDREVVDEKGQWYEIRVRPYITEEKKIDGAVLSFINITVLKKTEKELQMEREKYRTLAENSPDIITRFDKNLRYVYVNTAIIEATGIPSEEFAGKTNSEIELPKDLVETWNNVLRNTFRTGKQEKGEITFSTPKGNRTYEYTAIPEFSVNDTLETVMLLLSDTTKRKKTEDTVRTSLERFRSFIEVTGELGWTTNAEGEVVEDIPSFRKFTGQTYENVKGWGWSKVLHPDDLERTKRIWKEATKTKNKYEVEYRLRGNDGIYRHFLARGVPVLREDGSVLEWVGTCIDITGRKELEEELSNSLEASHRRQSEVSALLNASKAVLQNREFKKSARLIFDSCKELIGATAGYVALLSKDGKENEVLFLDSGGLPCTVDPSLPMPIRGLRSEPYRTGKVVYCNDFSQSHWVSLMPEGHVILKNVLFAPLINDNKILGVVGLANKPMGFTEHDAEMASAFGGIASVALINSRTLETLEEMVEERTKKLRDSERLAAIGETAGMVGHDIRNPLQAITGDVYLAKTDLSSISESVEKESVKESLDAIAKNVEYINKIVADLQDYAKSSAPCIEEVNLERIVQEVLSTVDIPESIHVDFSAEEAAPPKIKTDPAYMKRILTNLITNAIQAMPKGGKLSIIAFRKNEKVIISVADTGEGIMEKTKSKMFKPLFTTKAKGQGFGLAVVKKLTDALNGTITFESETGKGTKFTLEIPLQLEP
jgi:PAS domain S-box-containing protein